MIPSIFKSHIAFQCILIASVIFFIDISVPLGVAGGVPYIAVILVSLRKPFGQLTLSMALITSALTLIAYYISPSGGVHWMVITNRVLALFAIWTTAILGHRLLRAFLMEKEAVCEMEKAQADANTLRGLLPICSHCKKIRDEEGHWNQLETYIDNHSEAEFSHGVCPDCATKYFPDIDYRSTNQDHSHT